MQFRATVTTAEPCTDLNQSQLAEIGEQRAEREGAESHAEQQHGAEQSHHSRACMRWREISRQCEANGLHRMQSRADEQKGKGRRRLADDNGSRSVAGQDQEGEWHDRQPAKLQHRAQPQEGHPAPTKHGAVVVGAKADQSAEGCEEQRQSEHDRDDPRGDAQLHNHHAVERADQQNRRHADRDLEQRKSQEARHRQFNRTGISEGQEFRTDTHHVRDDGGACAIHGRRASKAWEM